MVLAKFSIVFTVPGKHYFPFPQLFSIDSEAKDLINKMYETNPNVMYHAFLTDFSDDDVKFLREAFAGSFLFYKSHSLDLWVLFTPFSMESWDTEDVMVLDEDVERLLVEHGNDTKSVVIPVPKSSDIN